ncbi:MAG: hypothetical protein KGH75_02430 [Rhodospirillales bacterium]|nr:hypothetical protein [Rhodospirillales bacterium]
MPMLDVTGVLFDPDFVDTTLTVARSAQMVGSNGLATNSPTTTRFVGVVVNDKGDILRRMAEGSRIVGSITIYTKFPLEDGSNGIDADVVVWRGRRYTVSNVLDYSTYGRGVIVASCDLIPLSGG